MIEARWDEREYGEQIVEPLSALKISFDRVWHLLKKAAELVGHTHRKWHVWHRIETSRAQLWTSEKSAVVTMLKVAETGLKDCHCWLAGGDLDECLHLHTVIEAWARENDCDRMTIVGRRGWKKALPDYREAATTFMKDIHP